MTERSVTIVCGPPCSGKTTYVNANAQPGDVVVDYDVIARSLGSTRSHNHTFKWHAPTERVISGMIADIESGKTKRAWVIRSLPREAERAALAQRLDAEVVVLDARQGELIARAQRRLNPPATIAAIQAWREAAAEG